MAPSIVAAVSVHLGEARQRAVDAVDEQREAEPGETDGKMALDRRVEGEQRDGAAGRGEDVNGEPAATRRTLH